MAGEKPAPLFTMSEQSTDRLPLISSYGPGRFMIAGKWTSKPVLLWPEGWQPICGLSDLSALTPEMISAVQVAHPAIDVLLIGTGPSMEPLPKVVHEICNDLGLAVEPMDSAAAARTLNVLLLEDRRVAGLLLPL